MYMDIDEEHLENELYPSHFNTLDTKFLEVSKEKLVVKYIGRGSHSYDVGSIQANNPFPTDLMIGYFEIHVIDAGIRGSICIGLSDKEFILNRQPGWEENSYGYLGEDGKKYTNAVRGELYAESFSTGDVIGCGIHFAKQEIFFTKNGKYLGPAFKKVKGVFYPTVGLHSPGETVMVNFGPQAGQKPFKFDLDKMENREKIMGEVMNYPMHVGDVNAIIRDYLLHFGYEQTLKSFEETCGGMKSELAHNSLPIRNKIRKLIMEGNPEEVAKLISETYPSLMADYKNASFLFKCQLFIEYIRRGKVYDAIVYAQSKLSELRNNLTKEDEQLLQDVLGLLAYESPENSPVGHLLKHQQREKVADAINKAILAIEKVPRTKSVLEKLLQQLVVTHDTIREESGGMGEKFDLSTLI